MITVKRIAGALTAEVDGVDLANTPQNVQASNLA